jgi:hypothetical protein
LGELQPGAFAEGGYIVAHTSHSVRGRSILNERLTNRAGYPKAGEGGM